MTIWKSLFLAALCCLLTAGCASREQRAAQLSAEHDAKCLAYGAKPGTDGYLQCRLAFDKMISDQKAALLASPDDGPVTCTRSGQTTTCY